MNTAANPPTLRPCGNQYHVELRLGPAQSLGGIHLPDNWRDNWTDAKVVAAGRGVNLGFAPSLEYRVLREGESPDPFEEDLNTQFSSLNPLRSTMWAAPGDVVLFQKHQFKPFGEGHRTGTVKDDDLIAIIERGTTAIAPLNDWVKIRQDPEIEREGAILYADVHRPRPTHGTIEAYGPGRFRGRGALYGTRKSVFDLMGLPRDMALEGLTVYWDDRCEVLACGREQLEFLLIKADDLWGYEAAE